VGLELSSRELSYLKTIFEIAGTSYVRLKDVALRENVKPPTAAEALARLTAKGLVIREFRGCYKLSLRGLRVAISAIRKHRVLETFLVEALGCEVDEACKLASAFDYAVPMEVVDRICSVLGHPSRCPHGKPIPAGTCHTQAR